jgi:predicted phosphodiesterase
MVVAQLPTTLEEAYIYPIGDLHLGDPSCTIDKLGRYLDSIGNRPNAYILLNGDLANTAIRSSVSNVHQEVMSVDDQVTELKRIFLPYRDRILAMTGGNHEARVSRETGLDLNHVIAALLGIEDRYRDGEVYLKVSLGQYRTTGKAQTRVTYQFYMTHGWAGGRRAGATANMLEDASRITDADVYVLGHTHKKMAFPLGYHRADPRNNTIVTVKRLFVSTGAYLSRDGYAVDKGYPPVWPGSARIRLDGRTKDAHASV